MATKINPPDLSSGNYELYKEKLFAWQMVTDIPVDKQGIVIALTLPNDDKHKIQEEVFSQIGREKLSQENGLDTLINFLDSKLMRDDYQDLLEEIDRKCELCKRYSKTPARPVVGMPMATQFNEKVAMDLKQWKGRWILHIIDMWSRYTISVFINRKRPSEVINALMQNWVGVFGVMGSILTDNGGEFNADEMREVMSILNVRVLTKAAELKIVVFTDASLGNINEGTGSTGAYIVWLMDNTGQCCPIAWNAHKIKRVVRSTLAAETLGLEEGLEASYYYREMLASMLGVKPRTVMIEAYVDNKSIIEAILSTRLVEDKRLRVDVAAIKESLQLHDVKKIQWVPGHLQLANPMTKQGASGFNLLKVLQSGKMLDELC